MSLTRKFLKAMGIEDDKIDQIIEAHSETVNALKDDIAEYKESASKLPDVQKELDELKKAAEKGEQSPYKVKYEALKEDFETFKKDIAAKESKANKERLYSDLLKSAGVNEKRIASVLKVTDMDSIEFDDDGTKLKDVDKLTDSIKKEWADFIVKTESRGADVSNPPGSNSGNPVKTKEEIMKIKDTAERQRAWGDLIRNGGI